MNSWSPLPHHAPIRREFQLSIIQRFEKHLPGYPQGDPATVRNAADSFRTLAKGLGNIGDIVNSRVVLLTNSWVGSDQVAFLGEWSKFRQGIADAALHITTVATHLDDFADSLDAARAKYNAALISETITVAAGLAFTVITFGASDELAAGEVLAEATRAVIAAEGAIATIEALLVGALDLLLAILPRLLVYFGINVVAQGIGGAIAYPDHSLLGHIDYLAALENAAMVVAPETVAGAVGRLAEEGTRANLALRVGSAAVTSSALNAGVQELTTGHVDLTGVLVAGGMDGLFESVTGTHAVMGKLQSLVGLKRTHSATESQLAAIPALRDRTYVPLDSTRAAIPDAVWNGAPLTRGKTLDAIIRADLQHQRPGTGIVERPNGVADGQTVNLMNMPSGVITHVRTIDPRAASYRNPEKFYGSLAADARALAKTSGHSYAGIDIQPSDVVTKELFIAMPQTGLTPGQAQSLARLIEHFPELNVQLVIL